MVFGIIQLLKQRNDFFFDFLLRKLCLRDFLIVENLFAIKIKRKFIESINNFVPWIDRMMNFLLNCFKRSNIRNDS